ncbi:rhomboid family intramembrane serine protease, partial [Rhizobium ruizarguesonis]
LLLWIGQQFFMLAIAPDGDVSWGAHVGGILAGAFLILVLRRPGVPLFDRQIVTPRAVRNDPGAGPKAGRGNGTRKNTSTQTRTRGCSMT